MALWLEGMHYKLVTFIFTVIDRWTLKAVLEDDLLEKPIDIKRSLICKLVLGNGKA